MTISLRPPVVIAIVILCSVLGLGGGAAAGFLAPSSYDEPNGYSGTYHYWEGGHSTK
jgi:hypothetical protein